MCPNDFFVFRLKDIRNKQKANNEDRKGFEFSITGFNNVFFATTDFLKVKGVFMKYDKVIYLFLVYG